MGVDIALVLGHSLGSEGLVAFPKRASSSHGMKSAAERLWHVMRQEWPNLRAMEAFSTFTVDKLLTQEGIVADWARRETPSFHWAGFTIYFGERAAVAVHLEKLAGFVFDIGELRSLIRACARALAIELCSPLVIYGPDSSSSFEQVLEEASNGSSLYDILGTAKRCCGDPVTSIREMASEDGQLNLHRACYFVESVDVGTA